MALREWAGLRLRLLAKRIEDVQCDECGETYESKGYEEGDGWTEPYYFVPYDEDEQCPHCEGKGEKNGDE